MLLGAQITTLKQLQDYGGVTRSAQLQIWSKMASHCSVGFQSMPRSLDAQAFLECRQVVWGGSGETWRLQTLV